MSEQEYEENIEGFRRIIYGFPGEKRYIIAIMHELSRCYRYLPRAALELTAEYVGVPFSQVYSMATFYRAFSLQPGAESISRFVMVLPVILKAPIFYWMRYIKIWGWAPGKPQLTGSFPWKRSIALGLVQ